MTCECGHIESIHVYDRKTMTRRCYHKLGGYTSRFCPCNKYRQAEVKTPALRVI